MDKNSSCAKTSLLSENLTAEIVTAALSETGFDYRNES